jgi:hypothetical protein
MGGAFGDHGDGVTFVGSANEAWRSGKQQREQEKSQEFGHEPSYESGL